MNHTKLVALRVGFLFLGFLAFMALGFFSVLSGEVHLSEMFSADLASSFLEVAGILILVGFIYFNFTLPKYLTSTRYAVIKIFLAGVIIIEALDNWYTYYAISPYLSASFLNIYFLGSLVLSIVLYITLDRSRT